MSVLSTASLSGHMCSCQFCMMTQPLRVAFMNAAIAENSFANSYDIGQRNMTTRIAQLTAELSNAHAEIESLRKRPRKPKGKTKRKARANRRRS